MSEVPWQNLSLKLLQVLDEDAVALGGPRDNLLVGDILSYILKLDEKVT